MLGVLLVGNSLREQVGLERSILWTGVTVAGSGILLGVLLGWWVTERVTRPVEKLADGRAFRRQRRLVRARGSDHQR